MPAISEKRRAAIRLYKATTPNYKQKAAMYLERYDARHPGRAAEMKRKNYIKRKQMCFNYMKLEKLIQTLEEDQTLTDTDKYKQLLNSFQHVDNNNNLC
jgi:hypothetical protein